MAPRAAVLVPVKDFARAKLRLADSLSADERAHLAQAMASTVVAAAAPLRAFVVCDSESVRTWAATVGADVLWTPGLGLNGAVQAGMRELESRGYDRVIVAHSDLPLAQTFLWLADGADDVVTIVPDRHLGGTNVMSVPAGVGFEFAYGPGSFAAHRAEAQRCEITARIVRDDRLGWDVDHPADLILPCP